LFLIHIIRFARHADNAYSQKNAHLDKINRHLPYQSNSLSVIVAMSITAGKIIMVNIQPFSALGYLLQGLNLMTKPGIRRYVWIPLLINIFLFSFGFYLLFHRFDIAMSALTSWLPSWLNWLTFLLWPIAILAILFTFSFLFSMVSNWLAAPFNGMLAARVEQYLVSDLHKVDERPLWQEIHHALRREWQKLKYWLPRTVLCAVFFFVPVVGQVFAPWLWLLFSAWMMAIQYCDYPYDNHKITFPDMRRQLTRYRWRHLSFGSLIMLLGSIPLLNLFLMPMAICASTAMWVDDQNKK
jgi:CysZ protein